MKGVDPLDAHLSAVARAVAEYDDAAALAATVASLRAMAAVARECSDNTGEMAWTLGRLAGNSSALARMLDPDEEARS